LTIILVEKKYLDYRCNNNILIKLVNKCILITIVKQLVHKCTMAINVKHLVRRCEIFDQRYASMLHFDVIYLVMDTLPLNVKYFIIDMLTP
jgi:hypothetical protein